MAAQDTDGLQALVAQHFERLNNIIANTIKQLEELQACLPPVGLKFKGESYTEESNMQCPACLKVHNPPYRFACDRSDEVLEPRVISIHIGHADGAECTAKCDTPKQRSLCYCTADLSTAELGHTRGKGPICGVPPQ